MHGTNWSTAALVDIDISAHRPDLTDSAQITRTRNLDAPVVPRRQY